MQDFNIAIEEYNAICDRIVQIFVNKYFEDYIEDYWWVGSEIGGVLGINGFFFSMTDILEFSYKQL